MTVNAVQSDRNPASGPPDPVHLVRAGETLSGIAERNGVSLGALLSANPQILHPDLIRAGQAVRLPEADGGSAREPQTYTVRAGDTLTGIAERTGADWRVLAQNNHLSDPDRLQVGQTLTLNGASAAPRAAPSIERPSAERPAPAPPPTGGASSSADGVQFVYRHEHVNGVSEHLHWPGGASGVTLGSGYDMGGKSADQITRDLTALGVPADQARVAAGAAGLTRAAARDYAAAHKTAVTLSPAQERTLLTRSLAGPTATVDAAVKVPLTRTQRDALISFTYNIGDAGFRGSTTLRRLNAGDYAGAADAMKMWNKSDGQVNQGLINRRNDEVALFNRASGPATVDRPTETRPAATAAPSGSARAQAQGYADMITSRGDAQAKADLEAGRTVLVGLRTPTRLDAGRGAGSYDDQMVMVRKVGDHYEAQTFRSNTEPSTQYLSARNVARGVAPPDVNGDGRRDLGGLATGQTIHYTRGTFLNAAALRADGDQRVGVRRDTNGDSRLDGSDPVVRTQGAAGMHIHLGGASNTWSMGCQTLPPEQHRAFFAALNGQAADQRHFSYVLLDAPR